MGEGKVISLKKLKRRFLKIEEVTTEKFKDEILSWINTDFKVIVESMDDGTKKIKELLNDFEGLIPNLKTDVTRVKS